MDFEVDDSVVERDRSFNPASADVVLLQESYFDMPVRFSIGDIKLIDGAQIPIYAIAEEGIDVLRRLPAERRTWLQPPIIGGLIFEMEGDDVIVFAPSHGSRIAPAPYDELLRAWEAFADKVRNFLLKEFPELRRHPQVGAWFRGEE